MTMKKDEENPIVPSHVPEQVGFAELFYGNAPEVFGWCGYILHNVLIVGILMAKGYGFIDVSMREVNYLFLKIIFAYLLIFRFLRHRYEKKYGKFKSEYDVDMVYKLPYMQFLYCINEYVLCAGVVSVCWILIFFK